MSYHENDPRNFKNSGRDNNPRAKRRHTKQKLIISICTTFVLLLVVLAVLIFSEIGMSIAKLVNNNKDKDKNPNNPHDTHQDLPEDDKNDNKDNIPDGYIKKTYDSSAVNSGNLVLVNSNHKFEIPKSTEENLIKTYDYRSQNSQNGEFCYKLKSSEILMDGVAFAAFHEMMQAFYDVSKDNNLIVTSAFRSYEQQQAIGSATKAGYSDSHTGLVIALSIYKNGQYSDLTDDNPHYKWLYDNAYKYGFITRYPSGKEAITGVSNYTECFRYVGKIHASVMKQNNFCLEEYIEYLKGFSADKEHLKFKDENSDEYEIYYIPKSNTEITTLQVPKDRKFTISGDNAGGFIVTVEPK